LHTFLNVFFVLFPLGKYEFLSQTWVATGTLLPVSLFSYSIAHIFECFFCAFPLGQYEFLSQTCVAHCCKTLITLCIKYLFNDIVWIWTWITELHPHFVPYLSYLQEKTR
jgi:hypothetical protein